MVAGKNNNADGNFPKYAGIWIALAALILAGIRFYIELQEWRTHGRDYMGLVFEILFFLATCILVGFAVWKNLKDATRAKSLVAQIVTLKDEHKLQLDRAKKSQGLEVERQQQHKAELKQLEQRLPLVALTPAESQGLVIHSALWGKRAERRGLRG